MTPVPSSQGRSVKRLQAAAKTEQIRNIGKHSVGFFKELSKKTLRSGKLGLKVSNLRYCLCVGVTQHSGSD